MANNRQIGLACEALALADLVMRGLEVTRPTIDSGDDFHVRTSTGWRSVQVKARDRRLKKTWSMAGGRRLSSSVLALVDVDTHEIRYQATELPQELA